MADRSYGTLTIYGTIRKIGDLKHLVEMIAGSQPHEIDDQQQITNDVDALRAILAAANAGQPLKLAAEELPGGEMEDIMGAAQLALLPYVSTWESHYAYSAGARAWDPKHGQTDAAGNTEDGPLLSFQELETALGATQRAKALRQLVDEGKRLRGETYSPLALSKSVRAYIAKELADE